ncbi:hypothetical protein CRENPOLYSF2_2930002 [Crenothrix polyspora]|uniref:Uncharacterized protein n=1 Tax=Crenothrix polyspora TaxID=360316 RepID=A0A1R4H9X2_9GAMM|nr:hypothetical protein CRENPOLYSF2_2930002 [Crenothrix polyspora]
MSYVWGLIDNTFSGYDLGDIYDVFVHFHKIVPEPHIIKQ